MKIFISVALAAFLLVGCSEEQSKPVETIGGETKTPTMAVSTAQKIDAAIESASKSADEISQSVQELSDTTVEKSKEIVEQAQEVTNEAVTKTKEVAKDIADEVQTSAAAVSESLAVSNEAGKSLYKVCSSCHGLNAEKPALGKSQVIRGWTVSKTLNALNGYKDGSYGGAMKAVMKGQAAGLSKSEANAIAEYISAL